MAKIRMDQNEQEKAADLADAILGKARELKKQIVDSRDRKIFEQIERDIKFLCKQLDRIAKNS